MPKQPEISVIVPLFDEEQNVSPLVRAVRAALDQTFSWELILVDDGSRDGTMGRARLEAGKDFRVRVIRLARNYGQTTAMQAGFDQARGAIIVSMDGDLQNDPRDIPRLVDRIRGGYDLVAGFRESRSERLLSRRIPSWAANWLIRTVTRVPIRDNGCTLKAFRSEVLGNVRLYSDLHRFIPALIAGTSSTRIAEIPVRHQARQFGRSKYGLSRTWKVLFDLMSVMMVRWFRERPLIMFAAMASAWAAVGSVFLLMTVVATGFSAPKAQAVVFAGATALWYGLAAYLFMLGLICEVALNREVSGPGRRGNRQVSRLSP